MYNILFTDNPLIFTSLLYGEEGLYASKFPLERSSPERQEAADGHVHSRVFVPGLCRDLPGNVASAAGRLEAASPVLSHDAADDSEREAHQHPGTQQEEHGGGRQSLSGAAPPVDRVHYTPCKEERSCGNE